MDWMEAVKFCNEIMDQLEDLPEEADDFRDSVGVKVQSICEWVEENEHVTDKQCAALINMKNGADKWLDY